MAKSLKGDYRQFMDKSFIGEWDLPEIDDLIVEIDHAEIDEVTNDRGKQDKLCVHLRGGYKPLILNATNGANISEALGTKDVAKWAGKKIILYRERVSAFGKTTMAVRVRTYPPKEEIYCDKCGGPIKAAHGKSLCARGLPDNICCPPCRSRWKDEISLLWICLLYTSRCV